MVHDLTSKSPAKVIFGIEIKLTGDLEFGVKPATEDDTTYTGKEQRLNELHEFMRTRTKMVSDRMNARYDRSANTEGFHDGQLVLCYNPQRKKGLSPNYKIIKLFNDVVYRIQKANSGRTKMKVVYIERLAKYGKRDNEPIRTGRTGFSGRLCYANRNITIRIKNNKQKLKQQLKEPTNTDKCRAAVTACQQRQQECVNTNTYTLI